MDLSKLRRALLGGLIAITGALLGCGGGISIGIGDDDWDDEPPGGWSGAEIRLLFFGNSHTLNHDVPGKVGALVRSLRWGQRVTVVTAPGSMLLDERLDHEPSVDLMQQYKWSAVVLQGQPYSSSGSVEYPTTAAETWIRRARDAAALPLMFPEWPRRGVDETARIYELHRSIARRQPACVPPIPQAFDYARVRDPSLALHEADGNHATEAGALLAALVITTTLTGEPPDRLPTLGGTGVGAATQATLRAAASDAVRAVSPWADCPADRRL